MSDPFKAVHADLKKAVKSLRDDAETKYNTAQKAQVESDTAVASWQGAQARLETFEREVLAEKPAVKATAKKTAKKTTAKKATKKTAAKKKTVKAKAKAAPKAKKKAAKKTAKKRVAKSATKSAGKPTKKAAANAAEGRAAVASGARPPLKKAIATIIGDGEMDAGQVLAGLEEKGWVPNAGKPRQYLSFVLSSSKDWFERNPNKRGVYKVRAGAPVKDGTAKKKSKKAKSKKVRASTNGATTKAKSTANVDQKLGDLGIGNSNVQSNPFAG